MEECFTEQGRVYLIYNDIGHKFHAVRKPRRPVINYETILQYVEMDEREHLKQSVPRNIFRGMALSYFAMHDDAYAVSILLLDKSIDINAEDEHGNTALRFAWAHGNRHIVNLLTWAGLGLSSVSIHGKRFAYMKKLRNIFSNVLLLTA